jgi:hypothetical protein
MTGEIALTPDRVAVIGGGRWARVLTDVLCGIVAPSVAISVHSAHNAGGMLTWAEARGLGTRIRVSPEWPHGLGGASSAVIVANAARDHEGAVERSLLMGVPVLVEKPMALTAAAAARLTELAHRRKTRLAVAHVFLFARYLDRFTALAAAAGDAESLRVEWTDPRFERRHGEQKRYDPGLSILADLLPHVFSLVRALAPNGPDRCDQVSIRGDGAEAGLALALGDIPCDVLLARDSDRRRRVIEAGVGDEVFRLDFSEEPGLISCGTATTVGDAEWTNQPRPVATMLAAFLEWASGGEDDDRLDINLGLRACRMIDETLARSGGGKA